jgi:hypothetical protein
MLSAVATGIKDFSLSSDGKEATFVIITKYSGDIAITVPTESLGKLQIPTSPAVASPTPAAATANPSNGAQDPARKAGEVAVSVPTKYAVATDLQRKLVVIVLDHQMPRQFGFALDSKAAQQLAAAIVKQADVLAAKQPGQS